MKNQFALALLACLLGALSMVRADDSVTQRPGEFFFSELSGYQGGPNAFLLNHAARLAWPAAPDSAQLNTSGLESWKSFQDLKFRGKGKGQTAVWRTLGPDTVSDNLPGEQRNISGRVTDLAIGPSCTVKRCQLWVGTAGGGLWRSDRALHKTNPGWRHLTTGLPTNNVGTVSLDPNDADGQTLYLGTGESNFNYTSGAGRGIFVSRDGGDHFTRLSTLITQPDLAAEPLDFTMGRGISQIRVKPGDADTIYVATTTAMFGMTSVRGGQSTITGEPMAKVGLYKTSDGGNSWVLLYDVTVDTSSNDNTPEGSYEQVSGVKDVQLDPHDPETVYVSVINDGLYRSSMELDGSTDFLQVFKLVTLADFRRSSYLAFDLTSHDGSTRVYLYNGNGLIGSLQALYRLDNANVSASSLFEAGENTSAWVNTTQPLENPEDFVDWRICGGQCVYDLVVKVPEGLPDTVYIGGQLSGRNGDSTVRSVDAGENFNSMSIDLQEPTAEAHVDVRSIVFHPDNPEIVFIGSDGGVVRSSGQYVDGRGLCDVYRGLEQGSESRAICEKSYESIPEELIFMNRGLQAMQLYNISADPNQPLKRLMAGTQDNSTQWYDGTRSAKHWKKLFGFGDGTSANGFHATDPDILFASFQSNFFFTHFDGGRGGRDSWTLTSGPIQLSGELSSPTSFSGRQFITFDPQDADTQFTGFEHIWRTRNNGGDRQYLEENCRLADLFNGATIVGCGDWEPLGEFLTREAFGDDRKGGVIVAAERSSADSGTLWAATSLGRLLISSNVDAPAEGVSFTRIDTASTPPRFISGIAVDDENPNRAFIAYSGFNAVTPDQQGHVFEVNFDGEQAQFTSLDYNLGDLPITHLVRDDLTGDLFAATDYGVLVLREGAAQWLVAGAGLPVVLTPHLEIHPSQRLLLAATHGLGAWYMNLDSP